MLFEVSIILHHRTFHSKGPQQQFSFSVCIFYPYFLINHNKNNIPDINTDGNKVFNFEYKMFTPKISKLATTEKPFT